MARWRRSVARSSASTTRRDMSAAAWATAASSARRYAAAAGATAALAAAASAAGEHGRLAPGHVGVRDAHGVAPGQLDAGSARHGRAPRAPRRPRPRGPWPAGPRSPPRRTRPPSASASARAARPGARARAARAGACGRGAPRCGGPRRAARAARAAPRGPGEPAQASSVRSSAGLVADVAAGTGRSSADRTLAGAPGPAVFGVVGGDVGGRDHRQLPSGQLRSDPPRRGQGVLQGARLVAALVDEHRVERIGEGAGSAGRSRSARPSPISSARSRTSRARASGRHELGGDARVVGPGAALAGALAHEPRQRREDVDRRVDASVRAARATGRSGLR